MVSGERASVYIYSERCVSILDACTCVRIIHIVCVYTHLERIHGSIRLASTNLSHKSVEDLPSKKPRLVQFMLSLQIKSGFG